MRTIVGLVSLAAALGLPVAGASAQCPEGRVATPETSGRCCWPGQTFAASGSACEGPPTCPSPLVAQGESCVPPQGAAAPERAAPAAATTATPRITAVVPAPIPWSTTPAPEGLLWPAAPDLENAVLAPRFVQGTDDGLVLAGLLTFGAGYLGGILGGIADQSAQNCNVSSPFSFASMGCDSWPLALVPFAGGVLAGTTAFSGSRSNVAIGVLVGTVSLLAQLGGLGIVVHAMLNPTIDVAPTIDLESARLTLAPLASASDAGLALTVEY